MKKKIDFHEEIHINSYKTFSNVFLALILHTAALNILLGICVNCDACSKDPLLSTGNITKQMS